MEDSLLGKSKFYFPKFKFLIIFLFKFLFKNNLIDLKIFFTLTVDFLFLKLPLFEWQWECIFWVFSYRGNNHNI